MRAGPRVRRERYEDAEPAIAALRAHFDEVGRLSSASALGRRYEPGDRIAARGEIRGPGRRRAGADLRGDGTVEAWTGWLRRSVIEPPDGETAWDALAREVRGG